jgi:hypothetical protein
MHRTIPLFGRKLTHIPFTNLTLILPTLPLRYPLLEPLIKLLLVLRHNLRNLLFECRGFTIVLPNHVSQLFGGVLLAYVGEAHIELLLFVANWVRNGLPVKCRLILMGIRVFNWGFWHWVFCLGILRRSAASSDLTSWT